MTPPSDRQPLVYSPRSQLRTPVRLARDMMADLAGSRELAWRLFVRDTTARYRQSLLGVTWAFVPPVLSAALFITLHARGVLNLPPTQVPYPVYALVGTFLWQIFADSVSAPVRAVQASRSLLARVNFPREALLVAAFLEQLLAVAIKLGVLAVVLAVIGHPVTLAGLAGLPAVVVLVLLGMAAGLIVTPLAMLYSDIGASVAVAVQFWFFLTPVVYPAPSTFPLDLLMVANPVSPILMSARELLTLGTVSAPLALAASTAFALGSLIVAWVLFRVAIPIIIERWSA